MFNRVRISRRSIRSGRRTADVIRAKKIVCYLYKKEGLSNDRIGLLVNMSKSGVRYALKSLNEEMRVNKTLREEVEKFLK